MRETEVESEAMVLDIAPLSEVKHNITYRLTHLVKTLTKTSSLVAKQSTGLNLVQWRLILVIGLNENLTASEIANYMTYDPGMMSRNISGLIDSKLIEATQDPTDRRARRLSLTPAGRVAFKATVAGAREHHKAVQCDFSEEQLDMFFVMLDKISAASKAFGESYDRSNFA
ncbi:MAG: MarR family winged helix-turn-helix transcriptional regulator [Pikeienuella sp.]